MGPNAMVQRITELTESEKGARAVLTLLADMEGDGVVGDNTLEGREEALRSFDIVVELDQLRFANRLAGRLADQKSVVNFREHSRDALAYALADRMDQLAFLALAGIDFKFKNNKVPFGGSTTATRPVLATGQNLSDLVFGGSNITSPTSNRHVQISGTDGQITSTIAEGSLAATHKVTYETIVNLKALAKDNYIRGIRGAAGEEVFHFFVTPQVMAGLKTDDAFLANLRSAGVRGPNNEIFAGSSSLMVDGVMVHEFRHVPNTGGFTSTEVTDDTTILAGSGNNVEVAANLFCGAQALAMADIGLPEIVEDSFDYGNQHGISIGKIFGIKKPVYRADVTATNEDFAVIRCDSSF
jgi:N4-gp56 family major capsid protein